MTYLHELFDTCNISKYSSGAAWIVVGLVMFTFAFLLAAYAPLFPHLVLYSAVEQHFHCPPHSNIKRYIKLQSHTLTGIRKQNMAPTVSDNDNVCICCFSFIDPQSKCQRRFTPAIPDASSHSTKFCGFNWKKKIPRHRLRWCDENRIYQCCLLLLTFSISE